MLAARSIPLIAALLSIALLLPALGDGLQLDDPFQRLRLLGLGDAPAIQLFVFYTGDPAAIRQNVEAGFLPWWTAPALKHASLRYLSVLTMMLDYALWPDSPALMRLHSYLWLGALMVAAALLYRRMLGATWIAGLATLLYAIDDAHAPPAAYVANRNAIIATCFGVLCLLCHARWREDRSRLHAWLAPICLALALAAGEIALATAAYLFAYAVLLEPGAWTRRLSTLVPSGLVLAVWAAAYKIGGFGTSGSGVYNDPLREPKAFTAALVERAPILLLGQWTPIPSDLGSVLVQGSREATLLWWTAIGVVVALVFLFGPLLRNSRVARFWACGALLSLVPIAAVTPQDRLLLFVGLGSWALLAQLAGSLAGGTLPLARLTRRTLAAAATLLIVLHLVASPIMTFSMLGAQREASAKMFRAIESVPSDAAIASQELVLLNPPDQVYGTAAIPVVKWLAGKPAPKRVRALANGGTAMEVTRVDATTLRIDLDRGLFPTPFSRYHRSPELRFREGDRVELDELTVEVLRLDGRGDPVQLLCRFRAALEDPALRWMTWNGERYVPWTPPARGGSVRVEAEPGLFG